MSGKKVAVVIVGIMLAATLAVIISISLFFKFYEPKQQLESTHEHSILTFASEQFIITLNSR